MPEFKNPLVTVVVPTYNRLAWIGECLDSILDQTYPEIEIIVVDDCSTDGTLEWLAGQGKYHSVVVHRQEHNGGASLARNTAIGMANGALIAFIDSDDKLEPKHIETAVKAFENDLELGLFCCDSSMIDADGNVILNGKTWHQGLAEAKGYDIHTGYRTLEDVFTHSNCFPGFTLRREVFEELGGFLQDIFPADDYDLALRVAGSRFKVFYLHEPLCVRREHDGQCSGIVNAVKTQIKLIEAVRNAVERNPELNDDPTLVSRRLAEAEMDLGISNMKEGNHLNAFKSIIDSIRSEPRQIKVLTKFGRRKLRRALGTE